MSSAQDSSRARDGAQPPPDGAFSRGAGAQAPPDASPSRGAGVLAERRLRWLARLDERGTYPRWVLCAALAGMFATTFPITILTIALGTIADEFAVAETTIAWVITAPMLCSAVALPLLGKLGDLHGHRRIFLLGFGAATATAGATALAWDAASLIGLRTLAAVVGGATQPTAMALIFQVYPPEHRVRAMGWWSMTGAAAPALGLILGGPLVDWLGWRVVFVLQASLSIAALALAALVLRETPKQRVHFDVTGAAVLAIGVAAFTFALARARDVSLLSPSLWLATGAGVAALALFVRVERRTPEPLFALDLLLRRNVSAAMLCNALQGAAYMGAFVLAPLVLLQIFGCTISQASAIMLLRTASLTVASPLGGRLGARIGERDAARWGCAVLTLSLFVVAWGAGQEVLLAFGAGLVLQGIGHGLALPSLTSAVANAVPERDLGIASAGNRLTSTIGTAFGITLLTLVYGGVNAGPAFARALLAGSALAALSLLAAWWMERDPSPGFRPAASGAAASGASASSAAFAERAGVSPASGGPSRSAPPAPPRERVRTG